MMDIENEKRGDDAGGLALLERLLAGQDQLAMHGRHVGGWQSFARFLLAEVAQLQMNPAGLSALLKDGEHPSRAARYRAENGEGVRISWPTQEQRLVQRFDTALRVEREKRAALEAVQEAHAEAVTKLDDLRIEMALMRLHMVQRSLAESLDRIGQLGPLTVLMVALTDAANHEDEEVARRGREEAKRVMEIIIRRAGDGSFVDGLGEVLRGYATSYDAEAGADAVLSKAASDKLVREWLVSAGFQDLVRGVMGESGSLTRSDPASAVADTGLVEAVTSSPAGGGARSLRQRCADLLRRRG